MAQKDVVELIENRSKFEVVMKPPNTAVEVFPGESVEADMQRVLSFCDRAAELNVTIFIRPVGRTR